MNDASLPSREGGARLRARGGRNAARRMIVAIVFVAGLLATFARTAIALVEDPQQFSPFTRRLSALGAFALELAGDPAHALVAIAVVTTVAGAIAAWRRSAVDGAIVAVTMLLAIDERFVGALASAAGV
jgi:hypothetical protein